MEVLRALELTRIEELKILHNVRLIHRYDLNPLKSSDNLRVSFDISGEIKGTISCFLCLDGLELSPIDRNYLFPLFVEAMNILIGRQISLDDQFSHLKIKISSPRLCMIPQNLTTEGRSASHKYELELESVSFNVLAQYALESIN